MKNHLNSVPSQLFVLSTNSKTAPRFWGQLATFCLTLVASMLLFFGTITPAQAGPFEWEVIVKTTQTVPFYNCAPGSYSFNLTAKIEGKEPPHSAEDIYTITGPVWEWTGATTSNGSSATFTRNYAVGDATDTVTAKATYSCTPIGDGECPGSDELVREGSKDIEVHIGSNTAFPVSDATVSQGTYTTRPIAGSVGTWGRVRAEDALIDISACQEGGNWKAILVGVQGVYSKQARLLPAADNPFGNYDIQEVTGVGGNTIQDNFCKQVSDLKALTSTSIAITYFMLSAVEAHENVHISHLKSDLESAVANTESTIEALSVPDTGQGQAAAVQAIKAKLAFFTAQDDLYDRWVNNSTLKADADHAGPAYDAERNAVKKRIETICDHAAKKGWKSPDGTPCSSCP